MKPLAFPERPPVLRSNAFALMHPNRVRIVRAHPTLPGASWVVARGRTIFAAKHSHEAAVDWLATQ